MTLFPRAPLFRLPLLGVFLTVASAASAGTMRDVSELCFDRSRDGREIRATLESSGWQQAVVDPAGRYLDLATAMVLEITADTEPLDDRFARAPQLAGNFEQMVLSGVARIYEREAALLYLGIRPLPEGGEQVTCILGLPSDAETEAMMAEHGGAEEDAASARLVRRVTEDDGAGRRSLRLWARLTQEPPRTPLSDLFYMERLTPND